MAGVTLEGFQVKRLNEIIAGLKQNAKPIFQDLVKPGDEVDTSDASTIGRLIGLMSLQFDECWQALQEVYNAFDPDVATGVALDNIVEYIGVTRRMGSPTVVRTSVWGLTGTYIAEGQTIRGDDGSRFTSTTALTFSVNDLIGAAIRPSPVEGEDCVITFITDEGIFTLEHTVGVGEGVEDVIASWQSQFDALALERVNGYSQDDKLYIVPTEYYAYITFPTVSNSTIVEVKKRLTFNSVDEGDIPAPLDTLTTILTPVYGWLSVNNEVSAERGSSYETDEELRERFRVSKALRANNMAESLYAQLIELEDVVALRIYENMTDLPDVLGLPAHSYRVVIRGGTDTNIGEVIWNNKPHGIATDGTTSVVVRDSQNIERTVKFSRAVEVPVYVKLEIRQTDATFSTADVETIREAIVNYLNQQTAFGEPVIYTRLFTPANAATGYQIDNLEIGKSVATLGTSNLTLNYDEYPVGKPELIDITILT